jgi:hypothetical protein
MIPLPVLNIFIYYPKFLHTLIYQNKRFYSSCWDTSTNNAVKAYKIKILFKQFAMKNV